MITISEYLAHYNYYPQRIYLFFPFIAHTSEGSRKKLKYQVLYKSARMLNNLRHQMCYKYGYYYEYNLHIRSLICQQSRDISPPASYTQFCTQMGWETLYTEAFGYGGH